jgi:hypothetical protein
MSENFWGFEMVNLSKKNIINLTPKPQGQG